MVLETAVGNFIYAWQIRSFDISYFLEFSIVEFLPHDNKIASQGTQLHKFWESCFPSRRRNVHPSKPCLFMKTNSWNSH